MPEVIPTGCRQGGLQLLCPFLVGLGEPSHLIGSQAKVTKHVPERLAVVDRVEELLPHLYGEPRLRIASEACPRGVVLRFTASVAVAAFQPAGQGAVCRLGHVDGPADQVISRTSCNCCSVQGGPDISPRESQRRTTGASHCTWQPLGEQT